MPLELVPDECTQISRIILHLPEGIGDQQLQALQSALQRGSVPLELRVIENNTVLAIQARSSIKCTRSLLTQTKTLGIRSSILFTE